MYNCRYHRSTVLHTGLMLLAAVFTSTGTTNAQNLIVNGSFESPDVPDIGFFESITGWSTTQNGLPWPASLAIVDNAYIPTDGTDDVNTVWGSQFQETFTATYQDIDTMPNGEYSLDFEYATFFSRNPEHHRVAFYAQPSGSLIKSFDFEGGPTGVWFHFSKTFTATSAVTRIQFERPDAGGRNTPGIDNVMVLQVPEPNSEMLLLIGMFSCHFLQRFGNERRRRASHRNGLQAPTRFNATEPRFAAEP